MSLANIKYLENQKNFVLKNLYYKHFAIFIIKTEKQRQ